MRIHHGRLSVARAVPVWGALALAFSCSDTPSVSTSTPPSLLLPGEICEADNRPELHLLFDPPNIVVAPGEERPVRLTVEPDVCVPNKATFRSNDGAIATAPAEAAFDLRHATYDFVVRGGALGKTSIVASMPSVDPNGKSYTVDVELPIEVRDGAPPTCNSADVAEGTLAAATPIHRGVNSLATSSIGSPVGAFTRTDEFGLPAFPVSIGCVADDLVSRFTDAPLERLGPAVSFTARAPLSMSKPLRRELDVAIPINPAAFPSTARMRHLVVLHSSPRARAPRVVPIASPRIESDGAGGYVLKFSTPWLGTFQAAVDPEAGRATRTRHVTHRAVIGFSMGGGGAATFGLRHHDKFDVIAPLGGPSDWTWLLWYIRSYVIGGFCPVGKACPKVEPNLHPLDEPYAHTMDYEHWFYENGNGNGGRFSRESYIQLFEDLSIALGNPNGSGTDPKLSHLASGPPANSPWVIGDPTLGLPAGTDCTITVDPIGRGDPASDEQSRIVNRCRQYRCSHHWVAPTGYFNAEFNPDGSLPVSTFCDGGENPVGKYGSSWAPNGGKPVNFALFVDVNKNGIRDAGEPVLRNDQEPFDDCGADGLCSVNEAGYDAEANPDPQQDDYDPYLNPTGLEGNHRWDSGEPFRDYGLDGVPGTAATHVAGDKGEGDGKFTVAEGLSAFYGIDPHAMLAQRDAVLPAGPLDTNALSRIDLLLDGGIRDLFNFAAGANHLSGQIAAHKNRGLPVRSVAFYNGFHFLPGEPFDNPNGFDANTIRWADVADMPNVRYGNIDATEAQILEGDGQHVGTAAQLLARLQTAFFFVGKRWPNADRTQTELARDVPATTTIDPELAAPERAADRNAQIECEVGGRCEHAFFGPRSGRTGPVVVSLPPGYAHQANVDRNVRYPVLYVLHGYGQDPRDLEAVAIFTNNYMNLAQRSYATRMPKFIIVYVDGRCRAPNGIPECIQGTFYVDSNRPTGAKLDTWFEEIMDFVDRRYRTKPAEDVQVTD